MALTDSQTMYCTLLHWLRSSSTLRERSPSGIVSLVTIVGSVLCYGWWAWRVW